MGAGSQRHPVISLPLQPVLEKQRLSGEVRALVELRATNGRLKV